MFGIVIGLIIIMMWIVFCYFLLVVIGMFFNLFIILMVIGGFGWLGFKINMGVVMIVVVFIGLLIDSLIYYIIGYCCVRWVGMDVMIVFVFV